MKRRVCVYIGGRANYSSAKSILSNIQAHPDLELITLVGAASVLDRYGNLIEIIEADGFNVDYRFFNLVEGETPLTMTKSAGLSIIETSTALDNLKPDIVLVVGDRYDVMPVAVTSVFMNIVLAHTMGGEVTGTIDESIRHAISKLAHVHLTANEDSKQRVLRMGEEEKHVHNVGCPRNDLVLKEIESGTSLDALSDIYKLHGGVGPQQDLSGKYLLVSQHSVSTEYGNNFDHMSATLEALERLAMPTLLLWPNSDAGSDEISRAVRGFRERTNPKWLHAFKDLPVETYIHLMNTTACLVGNSSSGIREGALIGTPVVNLGTRQSSRLNGKNVINVSCDADAIEAAIRKQLDNGRYGMDTIYGDGAAGKRIADILATTSPRLQKRITY